MSRPVVLSNGQMFVGLDENGLVHDFYYPYVGLENLTNARNCQHRIGVWVNNRFSWVNDGTWNISLDFETESLISEITMVSSALEIKLTFKDFLDINSNVFIRKINILNTSKENRDIRIFMHQMFQLSNQGRGDTALYIPEGHYILDYKGRYSLAIGGQFEDGQGFDQYAIGNYGIEGKTGTYSDAEDGELSLNPVEHGSVDSVIRFSSNYDPETSKDINYWIIASSSQSDDQAINERLKTTKIDDLLKEVRSYWRNWMHEGQVEVPTKYKKEIDHSLLIIKAHIDERGSILASGDSSIFNYGRDYYCYCWPRDASYALWPLIRMGHFNEARLFFEFARDTMHKDGYLMHKYQPDRAVGSTWHPLIHGRNKELAIQEDETASVVYMIGKYYELSSDRMFLEHIYKSFIIPTCNFMVSYVDKETGLPHASYDLWEEKFLTSTYTVCNVIAALDTATKLAKIVGSPDESLKWQRTAEQFRDNLIILYKDQNYFAKGFLLDNDKNLNFDYTVDISSLYGAFMYSGLDINNSMILNTAKKVEETILNTSPGGGVIRYNNDNYFLTKRQYLGNPWLVTTLWLAQYYIAIEQKDKAMELINWSLSRALNSGVLSEQFDPENLSPLSVSPLVWSHAELVNTMLDYYAK